MQVRELVSRVRDSLWFIPGTAVLVSAILAVAMVGVSRLVPDDVPLVFSGGAEGARGMLQAIASSMITVAGVTFSITIVALQLTSTQFSPRVLRNFMRDRPNQVVLATFMATFTYSLVVLRTIRAADESGAGAFVPGAAVSGAFVLVFVALGMLIYFIHHIATRIQVTSILASVTSETVRTVEEMWGVDEGPPRRSPDPQLPPGEPGVVESRRSGYLQLLGTDALARTAEDLDLVIRLELSTGGWAAAGTPVFRVWPSEAADRVARRLLDELALGVQRDIQQDVAFGIQQIVDVAVKALSPGVNDPTTATNCLDRLVEILVAAGRRPGPSRTYGGTEARPRLIVPYPDWDELVGLAFDQIRRYGAGAPALLVHLARALARVDAAVPAERRPPLRRQARLVAEAAEGIEPKADGEPVRQALRPLVG